MKSTLFSAALLVTMTTCILAHAVPQQQGVIGAVAQPHVAKRVSVDDVINNAIESLGEADVRSVADREVAHSGVARSGAAGSGADHSGVAHPGAVHTRNGHSGAAVDIAAREGSPRVGKTAQLIDLLIKLYDFEYKALKAAEVSDRQLEEEKNLLKVDEAAERKAEDVAEAPVESKKSNVLVQINTNDDDNKGKEEADKETADGKGTNDAGKGKPRVLEAQDDIETDVKENERVPEISERAHLHVDMDDEKEDDDKPKDDRPHKGDKKPEVQPKDEEPNSELLDELIKETDKHEHPARSGRFGQKLREAEDALKRLDELETELEVEIESMKKETD